MNRPIILDTDPGIDDAVAFAVLHYYRAADVRLIVTGYGNITKEHTVQNALKMCSLLHWGVPVLPASSGPVKGGYETAAHIHGADGLGGLALSENEKKPVEADDWLVYLYQTIRAAGTVDYITLGPLTNLAMLLTRFPEVKQHIRKIVTMGGGIDMGNVRPFAEFNIFCDPESASLVLREADDLALVPLNTTTTVAFTLPQIEEIGRRDTPIGRAMHQILTANYHACVRYGEAGSTMHDSTAVLYYLFPEMFTVQKCGIDVNCTDEPGRTVLTNERNNVTLTKETDAPLLLQKIMACVI